MMHHSEPLRLVVLLLGQEGTHFEGGQGCILSQGSCQYCAKAIMQRFIHCSQIQILQQSFEPMYAQTSGPWIL